MCCHHHKPGRGSGEALIAFGALVGMFTLMWNGRITSVAEVWSMAGLLGLIALFYFVLILCHIVLYWATTGGHDMAKQDKWWLAEMQKTKNTTPKK